MQPRSDLLLGLLLVVLSALLHWLFRHSLFSYFPAPLLFSAMAPWILSKPWRWLVPLMVVSELYSMLPLGIMTAVVAIPALVWKARGKTTVDISFSFLLLVFVSVVFQIGLLISPELARGAVSGNSTRILAGIPWQPMVLAVGATTSFSFFACILLHNLLPAQPVHSAAYARIKPY